METERIALSQRERDRLKVLHDVQQKQLTQAAAAERLKVTDRHVRRMLLRLREQGDAALVHGLRGRPSNRKLTARFEEKVLTRVGQRYADFGPTLAAEHVAQDGFPVSRETLRTWMSKAGFWRPRFRKAGPQPLSEQLRGDPLRTQFGRALSELGLNGSRPTVRKRKDGSRGCLKLFRIVW